ncbi:MAG: hypothetical protein J7530_08025 [Novosphingobium sp.]|nr:hypothetical protein [Novosphingobium sp.]
MVAGLRLFNLDGSIKFDTTSLAGRYVGTLTLTGPAQGSFVVPGLQPGNEVWLNAQYYNLPFLSMQDALVRLSGSTTIQYNTLNLPAGSITDIHYGFK